MQQGHRVERPDVHADYEIVHPKNHQLHIPETERIEPVDLGAPRLITAVLMSDFLIVCW